MAILTNVSVEQNSTAFVRTTPHGMNNWTWSPGDNHSVNNHDFLSSSLTAKILQVSWLVPSLVLILGLNVIFTIAVARSPSLWKPRFLLPVSLAVLDVLLALVFIPNSINNVVSENVTDSAVLCLTQCGVYYGTAVCTIATLFVMAWDRYRAICKPLHYREEDGIRWTWVRILAAWIYGTTVSVLCVIFTPIDGLDIAHIQNSNLFCTFADLGFNRVVKIIHLTTLAFFIVSSTYILISYFKIYKEIHRQNAREDGGEPSGNPQGGGNNHRPERTISIHLFIFVIFATAVFINGMFKYVTTSGQRPAAVYMLDRLAELVYLTVPCFSNPVVYGFRSDDVRAAVWRLFWRRERTNSAALVRRHRDVSRNTTRHLQAVSPLGDLSEESDVPTPRGPARLSTRPAQTPLDIPSDSDNDERMDKTVTVKAIIQETTISNRDTQNEVVCTVELPGYVSSLEP
ncbi:hypothetical protein Bbelb_295560 [Branchiostoma belcheri]|nr:hypothetical protein Bbelb_295560 [Branchiostoma belcheri]